MNHLLKKINKIYQVIYRFKNYKVLFICHSKYLKHVGSEKSVHEYEKFVKINSEEQFSRILYLNEKYGFIKLLIAWIYSKNIILNGIRPLLSYKCMILSFFRPVILYPHETEYVFNNLKEKNKFRMFILSKILTKQTIFHVSKKQKKYFSDEYNCSKFHLIYNCISPSEIDCVSPYQNNTLNILMVGTIQKRKGVEIFSRVADHYANNMQIQFHWVGHGIEPISYKSKHVNWHGKKVNPFSYIKYCDILFLSSVDDPFPLSVLEALFFHRKIVLYKNIGTEEIINNIDGCEIFDNYEIDSVISALERVMEKNLDNDRVNEINRNISSVESFVRRINQKLDITFKRNDHPKISQTVSNHDIKFDRNKCVVIAGNGPSCLSINTSLLPDQFYVFRTNFFFLEEKKILGSHIDGYFWAVHNTTLHDYLSSVLAKNEYFIDRFFCPVEIRLKELNRQSVGKEQFSKFQPHYDHWQTLASDKDVSRMMMSRPLPTSGIQMIAYAMVSGFKNIYVTGIDFYRPSRHRYGFNIPKGILKNMDSIHFKPGYEKGAHSFERDLFFLNTLRQLYPDVKLTSLSEDSFFQDYLNNIVS